MIEGERYDEDKETTENRTGIDRGRRRRRTEDE
jgi:hypothetical protein